MPFKFTPGKCCNPNTCETWNDNFNRPDSGTVGNGWVEDSGDFDIEDATLVTESEDALLRQGDELYNQAITSDAMEITLESDNTDAIITVGRYGGAYGGWVPGLEIKFGEDGYIELKRNGVILIHRNINLSTGNVHKIGYQVCDAVYKMDDNLSYVYVHTAHVKIFHNDVLVAERKGEWSAEWTNDPPTGGGWNGLMSGVHQISVADNTGRIEISNVKFYLNMYNNPDCGIYQCEANSCMSVIDNLLLEDGTSYANGVSDGPPPPPSDVWEIDNEGQDNDGELVTTDTDSPASWNLINYPGMSGASFDFDFYAGNDGLELRLKYKNSFDNAHEIGITFGSSSKATAYEYYHDASGTFTYHEKVLSLASATWHKISIRHGTILINDTFLCTLGSATGNDSDDEVKVFYAIRIMNSTTFAKMRRIRRYINFTNNTGFQGPCDTLTDSTGNFYKNSSGEFVRCDPILAYWWLTPFDIPSQAKLVINIGSFLDGTYFLDEGTLPDGITCSYFLDEVTIDDPGSGNVDTWDITWTPRLNQIQEITFVLTNPLIFPLTITFYIDMVSSGSENSINDDDNTFFSNKLWITRYYWGAYNYSADGSNYGYIEYTP